MTTLYDMLASPLCAAMWLGFMVGMAALLCVIAIARSSRMPARHVAVPGALFALAFAFVLFGTGVMQYIEYWHRPLPSVYELFGSLPFAVYVALLACVAATCAVEFAAIRRWRAGHIAPSSVKDAVDRLPQGLRFADASGRVVLENLAMAQADAGSDGKTVWKRAEREIDVRGERFTQETATDVTAWHDLNGQLQARVAELRDMQDELVRFQQDVKDVVREQEMLEAKVAVHDELGHLLLTTERYLADPQGDVDAGRLLALWETALDSLMRGMEADEGEGDDAVARAAADARDMGVSVVFEGALPEDPASAGLVARAVRECAANAAKHAGATELRVGVAVQNDGSIALEFTNDGQPPREGASETGGLVSLRRSVEAAGGTMHIEWGPSFAVRLIIPE